MRWKSLRSASAKRCRAAATSAAGCMSICSGQCVRGEGIIGCVSIDFISIIHEIVFTKSKINKFTFVIIFDFSGLTLPRFSLPSTAVSLTGCPNKIPGQTIQNYESSELLRASVSERAIALAQLYARGFEFMGKERFLRWMNRQHVSLGRKRPIDLLDTHFGMVLIGDELGRIEHGVLA